MATPGKATLRSQLKRLRDTGLAQKLQQTAEARGLTAPFFFAIASRETNCRNILGDLQHGEFHGVGIIQIDIQHPIARKARDTGTWKTDPGPLIEFGAKLLADNLKQAKQKLPNLSAQQQLKAAASGYNSGMVNAVKGAKQGDSDKFTTGHDYGRDVMARAAIFEELTAAGN
jgi:hypothetical protein